jgi:hypothetical protein
MLYAATECARNGRPNECTGLQQTTRLRPDSESFLCRERRGFRLGRKRMRATRHRRMQCGVHTSSDRPSRFETQAGCSRSGTHAGLLVSLDSPAPDEPITLLRTTKRVDLGCLWHSPSQDTWGLGLRVRRSPSKAYGVQLSLQAGLSEKEITPRRPGQWTVPVLAVRRSHRPRPAKGHASTQRLRLGAPWPAASSDGRRRCAASRGGAVARFCFRSVLVDGAARPAWGADLKAAAWPSPCRPGPT